MRRAGLLGLLLLQSACGAGWRQPPAMQPGPLPERQQVQVWVGNQFFRWHSVRLGPDSISGVPFLAPPSCDSCRVSLPRAGVDSIRVGNPTRGFLASVGLTFGALLGLLLIACQGGPCQFGN